MAPKLATQDMFVGNPLWAQHGPLAIAVPGEMKCFKVKNISVFFFNSSKYLTAIELYV